MWYHPRTQDPGDFVLFVLNHFVSPRYLMIMCCAFDDLDGHSCTSGQSTSALAII
jgi:hypothetical protein